MLICCSVIDTACAFKHKRTMVIEKALRRGRKGLLSQVRFFGPARDFCNRIVIKLYLDL